MIATLLAGAVAVLMGLLVAFAVWILFMLGLSMLHDAMNESAARFIGRCACPACSAWREHHGSHLRAMRWGYFREDRP